MKFNNTAILTDKGSWIFVHVQKLQQMISEQNICCDILFDHHDLKKSYDVIFILGYMKIIPPKYLKNNTYNLVVHESDLPAGKGWAPLFWQVIEGKNKIPVVLFEANEKPDSGPVWLKDFIILEGIELHDELRQKQGDKTVELCMRFIINYNTLKPIKQQGKASFYKKRTPLDSELDINKSLKEQFNLLRTVNNEAFPAYFKINNQTFFLKIYKSDD